MAAAPKAPQASPFRLRLPPGLPGHGSRLPAPGHTPPPGPPLWSDTLSLPSRDPALLHPRADIIASCPGERAETQAGGLGKDQPWRERSAAATDQPHAHLGIAGSEAYGVPPDLDVNQRHSCRGVSRRRSWEPQQQVRVGETKTDRAKRMSGPELALWVTEDGLQWLGRTLKGLPENPLAWNVGALALAGTGFPGLLLSWVLLPTAGRLALVTETAGRKEVMTAAVSHRPGRGRPWPTLRKWGLAKLGIGLGIQMQGVRVTEEELGDPKDITSSVPGHFIMNTARCSATSDRSSDKGVRRGVKKPRPGP